MASPSDVTKSTHPTHLHTAQPLSALPKGKIATAASAVRRVAPESFTLLAQPKEAIQHVWGDVIILVGSSTAGKTTIIKELLKQRPDFYEEGGDLAAVRIPMAYLEQYHEEDLAFLKQVLKPDQKLENSPRKALILDYLLGEKPVFRDGISDSDTARYFEVRDKLKLSLTTALPPGKFNLIMDLMLDGVLERARKGQPVIFDILRIEEVFGHALGKEHPSIKIALVYCPFKTLAQRIVIRNSEAIRADRAHDVRPGIFPLEQFCELFEPKQGHSQLEAVQHLTKKEAEEAFDIAYLNGEEYFRNHEPDHLEEYIQENKGQKAKILANLGFSSDDPDGKVVELVPKFNGYHVIVNTTASGASAQNALTSILFKPPSSPAQNSK